MSESCELPIYMDPETHEQFPCKEMPPMDPGTQRLLTVLKTELSKPNTGLNVSNSHDSASQFRHLIEQYRIAKGQDERDVIVGSIQEVLKNHKRTPEIIELEGWFSLVRYRRERDPIFIIATAHRIRELHDLRTSIPWWWMGLWEDFYGIIFAELDKEATWIPDILPRILKILGPHFRRWLLRELRERNDMGWSRGKDIQKRYEQYYLE